MKVGEATGDKVTIEIEVTNDVGKVDSVTVTNLDTGKTYEATFSGKSGKVEVDSNGTYKVEVKATTDGSQRTGQTTVTVDKIEVAFTKEYGKIDVIWVNTENEKIDEPLAPVLNGENPMKKVYWEDDGTEVKEEEGTEITDSEWYDYVAGDNSTDSKNSHWANAINTVEGNDGYFVWIPRYAYRIIYYADKGCTKVAGYCDGDGIREVNGTIHNNEELKEGTEITKEYNGYKYIVHPAFEDNVNNGGWNSDLQGIWVGKYESVKDTATADNSSDCGGDGTNIKIVPNVTSWRNEDISTFYDKSKSYDEGKKSHLMKNSEWGAVAYLTHSQYGRNGNEVNINDSSDYITGSGKGTENKNLSSSTGNEYGVFDLSGGAYEYVAAYNEGTTSKYGKSLTGETKQQYVTKYNSLSNAPEYVSYYTGDATYEVDPWKVSGAWFDDSHGFVFSGSPFFIRGGEFDDGDSAGVFSYNGNAGFISKGNAARVVLAGV